MIKHKLVKIIQSNQKDYYFLCLKCNQHFSKESVEGNEMKK